ncbi:Methyltransferase domain-containing protein [Streptomyces sp. TLI_053]|uniref:class I SAM-dependent methyltransferase n=1 Tax=Streptomyces sp. TLI_053 TaxID=1855352 RepID=UPI00087BD0F3|nr:class I SAM-dependent methyltransferase [Streptomyces sp. TLI_053]SDT82066.1 Methyltransferase domain-containing protein [Streptomyces sp. TLI_053]
MGTTSTGAGTSREAGEARAPGAGAPPHAATGPLRVLDTSGAAYRRAFELFLAGTDEKPLTHARLTEVATGLDRRRVLLDVGAGEGRTTAHLAQYFERTVAIEPSAVMRERLRTVCPDALVLPDRIDAAEPPGPADLVHLSHVLYYVPPGDWLRTVGRVLDWVAPGGTLLVVLQNPESPCMRMAAHFAGVRYDLRPLAEQLAEQGPEHTVALETLDLHYRTDRLAEAVDVAEFMVNVADLAVLDRLPDRDELTAYVERHFARPDGGYAIGHTQDMLTVRRAPR